jgi:GNAT superfamily N-acetyltransferase
VESARFATADDAAALVALSDAALTELSANRGGAMWARRDALVDRSETAWIDRVDAPDTAVIVGAIDDVVVGYGTARIETLCDGATSARLDELFVEEPARAVGVGDAVLEAMLAWAEGRGAAGLDALVLPGDRSAKNFFEAHAMVARAIVVHRPLGRPRP